MPIVIPRVLAPALALALLLGACASPALPPSPGARANSGAPGAAACRQEAERVIRFRDRGQIMREDERDARIGSESSIYARRGETDRLGRIFERDRLAADCVAQSGPVTPPR